MSRFFHDFGMNFTTFTSAFNGHLPLILPTPSLQKDVSIAHFMSRLDRVTFLGVFITIRVTFVFYRVGVHHLNRGLKMVKKAIKEVMV